ncbi:hypothetical protein NAT51_16405 [Flavobacterium amniphilum]|uniref:hypothetical protein n=1 Tax=Flavobacterium amniphilum TaxID=1834035 RepID=UPI00202AAB77|nr:hypothetical protein [Flavobacterium amniphilum]MCL9807119.1 hypothetical protein [Flavobacterium amniphilum]
MRKIMFLALFGALTVGCSTDSESSGNGSKIKKVEIYQTGGPLVETDTYSYNSDGLLAKIVVKNQSNTITNTYEYADGRMSLWTQVDKGPFEKRTETRTFIYDANNNIIEVDIDRKVEDNDDPDRTEYYIDKIEYEYINNQPVAIKHFIPHNYFTDSPRPDFSELDSTTNEEELDYTGQNMTYYYPGEASFNDSYFTYEYDSKNHPMSGIEPANFRNALGFSTVNNISKGYEYAKSDDELLATIYYTYTYNASNMPTKLVKKYDAGILSGSTTYKYFY